MVSVETGVLESILNDDKILKCMKIESSHLLKPSLCDSL